ncbi:DUF3147 family protein [Bradyrhizobium manausense]|uniref:DUF3147 family protein n=1 Tax=Bradyrhizobium TaxID=374 RepID=UPI001BAC5F24|nr:MULTISPECIES: DUF3147 family protein [Bradyrhizobium]MBR0831514.1 DUF3147 family protein [Bradyrhizobium manausense]UVO27103.1 DUF3147 family protein [Bradyrhizobium arachidis]
MIVTAKLTALAQDRWYDYVVRYVLGGFATLIAGLVADAFGPSIGGLMLAFPAILCASTTLIERNERKRKERKGLPGGERGRQAAALDAAGAALGSVALLCFAATVWQLAPHGPWVSLPLACLIWLPVAIMMWWLRRLTRRVRFPGRSSETNLSSALTARRRRRRPF